MWNYTVFSSINNNNEAKTKAQKKKKKSSRQIDNYDSLSLLCAGFIFHSLDSFIDSHEQTVYMGDIVLMFLCVCQCVYNML